MVVHRIVCDMFDYGWWFAYDDDCRAPGEGCNEETYTRYVKRQTSSYRWGLCVAWNGENCYTTSMPCGKVEWFINGTQCHENLNTQGTALIYTCACEPESGPPGGAPGS